MLKVQASHQASLDLPPRAEAPRPQAFSTLSLKTPTASAFTCVLSGHVCFKWPAPVSLEISYHPPASAASAPRAHDLKKGQAALGGGSPWQRHRSYITDTNRCAWPENHEIQSISELNLMLNGFSSVKLDAQWPLGSASSLPAPHRPHAAVSMRLDRTGQRSAACRAASCSSSKARQVGQASTGAGDFCGVSLCVRFGVRFLSARRASKVAETLGATVPTSQRSTRRLRTHLRGLTACKKATNSIEIPFAGLQCCQRF